MNFVRNGVSRIVGFIAGIVGPVVNYARNAFFQFASLVNQAFSPAVNFVRNGVIRIVGFVADLRSRVGNLILSLSEMAFNAGVNFINRLVQGIASRIESVTAKVRQVTQSIRNLLPGSDAKEGPLSDLMASGRALFETFANGINGGPLTSILGNVLGQAGGIISNASTAFAGLSRAVNSGMSAALEIVKTKSAQIIAAIVAIATPIFNAMTTAMGRLLSAAQSGLNQAVSLMQRLGAQLVSTLLSFSDQFFDAGKRLMDRFNAGINASVSSSMALMSSAAQSSANLLPVPRPPSVSPRGWLPPPPPLPGGIGGPSGTSAPLPVAPSGLPFFFYFC